MSSLRIILALTTLLTGVGANPTAVVANVDPARPPFSLTSGQPAPALEARDAEGTVRRLCDLRGQKLLLLTFFPRCFTFSCTSQLTSLREAYPELQKQDVEVWAVSNDPAQGEKGQRAYAQHLKLPFPLLPDEGRETPNAEGCWGQRRLANPQRARIESFRPHPG